MKIKICRRTSVAIISIACLTVLGWHRGMDVSMAIASVAIGLAGANSYEKSKAGAGDGQQQV